MIGHVAFKMVSNISLLSLNESTTFDVKKYCNVI